MMSYFDILITFVKRKENYRNYLKNGNVYHKHVFYLNPSFLIIKQKVTIQRT